MDADAVNRCSHQVIASAMTVHSTLGPGLLESTYGACLAVELRSRGLGVDTQLALPVIYRGRHIELGYRLDMVVEGAVVVEVKAVTKLLPVHSAQLMSYLRLSGYGVGLLVNFHVPHLRDGIRRLVNCFGESARAT